MIKLTAWYPTTCCLIFVCRKLNIRQKYKKKKKKKESKAKNEKKHILDISYI